MGANDKNTSHTDGSAQGSSRLGMLLYALPVGGVVFLMSPMASILPALYAKYFGLELTAIAGALLMARLFDAFLDPVIGHYSDRRQERTGSRKLWIITGGLCIIISAWFLFAPPAGVSIGYFLFWSLLAHVAWSLFDIPHMAWGTELITSYQDRARLFSYRSAMAAIGSIAFFLLPFMPIFASSEYTPETMKVVALTAAFLMVPALISLYRFVPNGAAVVHPAKERLTEIFRSIFYNKPLLIFVMTYFLTGLGFGMWMGLLFIYLDAYLQIGEQVATIFLAGTAVSLIGIPVWLKFIQLTNKKVAWISSTLISGVVLVGFVFAQPGDGVMLPLLLTTTLFFSTSCTLIVAPSILADIVDYGTWKFGRDRGATYFAFFMLITKTNAGLGAAAGLAIVGLFGFDAAAVQHNEAAIFGLRLAFILLPATLVFTSIIFVYMTPICSRRHAIIRKSIDRRVARHELK